VLGSVFFGWAGQRWNKLALLGGIYIVRSIALAWYFTLPPTPATTLLFGASWAFCGWALGRWCGRRRRDVRTEMAGDDPGLAFMSHQLGSFLGAFGAACCTIPSAPTHGVAESASHWAWPAASSSRIALIRPSEPPLVARDKMEART